MSYIVKVKVGGEQELVRNGLFFATREEADGWARDLYSRWTLMKSWVIEESETPANSRWVDGKLERLEEVKP